MSSRYIQGALLSSGGGSGASTWGSITGDISNQTDLTTALNSKLDKTSTVGISSTDGSVGYILEQGTYQAVFRNDHAKNEINSMFFHCQNTNSSANQCSILFVAFADDVVIVDPISTPVTPKISQVVYEFGTEYSQQLVKHFHIDLKYNQFLIVSSKNENSEQTPQTCCVSWASLTQKIGIS